MKIYRVLIFFIVALASCTDYLVKNPLDSLTKEQAFANEQNLQLYVNSFYPILPTAQDIYGASGVIEGYYFIGDVMADITSWSNNITYLTGGFSSQTSQGWTWTNLRNVNYFLANYSLAKASSERKNHYAGIARFFRSWFYFEKVKHFGDVPWYGEALSPTSEALYKARDPRTVVMDSVLADIDFAIQYISGNKDNTASTVTKSAALAFKSRICLFEGTFRKYHPELGLSGTADFWLKESVKAADQLIKEGTYSLNNTGKPASDYRQLFISASAVSREVILARTFSDNLRIWHTSNAQFANVGAYQTSLTRRFVNTYLNLDGSRFTDKAGYNEVEFIAEMQNRDSRLAQTIRTPGYKRTDGSLAAPYLGNARTGYHILKYSLDDKKFDELGQCNNAIPLIRYAEVLLNYAEAKAELGELTTNDWNLSIGKLRERAGIQNTAMPTSIDPYMKENFYNDISSIAIMEVRRERAIELMSEGFRYSDLKRWNQGKLLEVPRNGIYVKQMDTPMDLDGDGKPDVCFVEKVPASPIAGVYYYIINNTVTKLSNGTSGNIIWQANSTKTYPDYKYYAPLPMNELVINPQLTQNPGWN